MLSSTALKLFSLALRRTSRLKEAYTSSPRPPAAASEFMSSWYCAVSSATVSVRRVPRGAVRSPGRVRPLKSFISLPSASIGGKEGGER
jgi:hypothetical protein